jgi:alpha-L-fucosidase 2
MMRLCINFGSALPSQWSTGSIQGLRALGAFEVNLSLEQGALAQAQIISYVGGKCTIRSAVPFIVTMGSEVIQTEALTIGLLRFETVKGGQYILTI